MFVKLGWFGLLTTLGCATTATISRTNGGAIEAEIGRSDQDAIYVLSVGGPEVTIPRQEISDIDHPGNVAALVGGIVGGVGALNFLIASGQRCFPSVLACGDIDMAVGIPLFIWGLTVWNRSKDAANNFSPPTAVAVPFEPGTSRAEALSQGYRQPGSSPGAGSAAATSVGGYQNTQWGMTIDSVKSLVSGAEVLSSGELSKKGDVAGMPSAVTYRFHEGKLVAVAVRIERQEGIDLFPRLLDLLRQKYGQPTEQGTGTASWRAPDTAINLKSSDAADAVTINYESTAFQKQALEGL